MNVDLDTGQLVALENQLYLVHVLLRSFPQLVLRKPVSSDNRRIRLHITKADLHESFHHVPHVPVDLLLPLCHFLLVGFLAFLLDKEHVILVLVDVVAPIQIK